jgi:hypothetical protein
MRLRLNFSLFSALCAEPLQTGARGSDAVLSAVTLPSRRDLLVSRPCPERRARRSRRTWDRSGLVGQASIPLRRLLLEIGGSRRGDLPPKMPGDALVCGQAKQAYSCSDEITCRTVRPSIGARAGCSATLWGSRGTGGDQQSSSVATGGRLALVIPGLLAWLLADGLLLTHRRRVRSRHKRATR